MSQNQDGSDAGVYYRNFNSAGAALGAETAVNTTTSGAQNYPAIAFNTLSSKVGISWASADQDGDAFGIYARLFGL